MVSLLNKASVSFRRVAASSVPSTASAVPSKLSSFALIAVSVLFVQSCRTVRRSESVIRESRTESLLSRLTDSASVVTERRLTGLTVPESSVRLTIAPDSLQSLPAGASYNAKSGQARVEVSRKPAVSGTAERIVVYATCDSLQLVCEEYEKEIRVLRSSAQQIESKDSLNEAQEVSEKRSAPFWTGLKGGIIGFLFGVLAGFFLTALLFIRIEEMWQCHNIQNIQD